MKSVADIRKERTLSVRIILISLVVCVLVAFCSYLGIKFGKPSYKTPALFAFMLFFILAGVTFLVLSAWKKDFFVYIAGSCSLTTGVVLLMCLFSDKIPWYVIIVTAVILLIIAFFLLLMFGASRTVLIADNEDPEYKDYKQRRAEKPAEQPKEEELPELKSFK